MRHQIEVVKHLLTGSGYDERSHRVCERVLPLLLLFLAWPGAPMGAGAAAGGHRVTDAGRFRLYGAFHSW